MQPCLFQQVSESVVLGKQFNTLTLCFQSNTKKSLQSEQMAQHIFSLALCSHGIPDCVGFPIDCCKTGGPSQMSCFATQHQKEGGKWNPV